MKCPDCGHEMSSDSDFCMNCGSKVAKVEYEFSNGNLPGNKHTKVCNKCNKEIAYGSVFCPSCGAKQNNTRIKYIFISVAIVLLIIFLCIGITIHNRNLISPIDGVSQKVYTQGMEYIETMESASVRKATMAYVKSCKEDEMKDIHNHIDGVDFNIELGKNPTEEEIYFAKLISKFWESWAICYGHESIIAEYENSDETGVQMAASMYKGIVSGFKNDISEAKDILKKADDYTDMQKAYRVLEDIWEGEGD